MAVSSFTFEGFEGEKKQSDVVAVLFICFKSANQFSFSYMWVGAVVDLGFDNGGG
jgi:hypothetical protein